MRPSPAAMPTPLAAPTPDQANAGPLAGRRALGRLACGLVAGLALPGVAVSAERPGPAEPGQPVRWPQVRLLDGGSFGPGQAQGQAIVVVFWSIHCPFCRRHNPRIQRLHEAAAGRGLQVLGVARESDESAVRRHAREHGYSFPLTLEHAPLAAALSSRRLVPLTVTVDPAGLLRQVIPGEMAQEDVMDLLKLAARPAAR